LSSSSSLLSLVLSSPLLPSLVTDSEPTYAGQGVLTAPIFGSTIDDAVRISHIPGTPMVPAVLYRCAEFLESKGVDEVGLYR